MKVEVVVPEEIVQDIEFVKGKLSESGGKITVAFSVGPMWLESVTVADVLDAAVASLGVWAKKTKSTLDLARTGGYGLYETPELKDMLGKIAAEKAKILQK